MAKKAVSSIKKGTGKDFSKVIKMERSKKSGAYIFKEEMIHNDFVEDFFKKE